MQDSLLEFSIFRNELRSRARANLEIECPQYVAVFRESYQAHNDLEVASSAAEPYLGEGLSEKWKDLLRLTLDYEFSLDQVKRALSLMLVHPVTLHLDWNLGAWLFYNMNHWTFQIYSWLERLEAIVKKACRNMLRPVNSEWQAVQDGLVCKVQALKENLSKVRNPLAHTGSGGYTEAISEARLWEPGLLIGWDGDLTSELYRSMDEFQELWYEKLLGATKFGIALSELIFKELNSSLSETR